MKQTMMVLISGRIGSGKTTLANYMNEYFVAEGYNSKRFSFAHSLKVIAKKVFSWDGEKNEEGRAFLQDLGKTVRKFNPIYWVENTQIMIENDDKYPFDVIIIDDWRYPNEAEYLENDPLNKVYKIRISGDNEKADGHESENSLPISNLDNYYFKFTRIEQGLEYLEKEALKLCQELLETHLKGEK